MTQAFRCRRAPLLTVGLALTLTMAACGRSTTTTSGSPSPATAAPATATPQPNPSASAVAPSPARTPDGNVHSTQLSPIPSQSPVPSSITGPAPAIITQSDGNRVFQLRVGATAQLQLSEGPVSWSDPQVSSPAVRLTPIAFIRDPGYRAWTVTGVTPGQATISAYGQPHCSPGTACPMYVQVFQVTVQVLA